jgi:hypothetical protein
VTRGSTGEGPRRGGSSSGISGPDDLAAVVYTSGRTNAVRSSPRAASSWLAAIDRFVGRKLPSVGAEKLAVHLRDADLRAGESDDSQPGGRTREGLDRGLSTRDPTKRSAA